MPELPEVESVRLTLEPRLAGRSFTRVNTRRPEVIEGPATPAALLVRDTVGELRRRGKQLAIIGASGRVLVVHLGMTGQLMVSTRPRIEKLSHVHILWTLQPRTPGAEEELLVFRDPRRFGGIWPLASTDELEARWKDLGPDALTISGPQLKGGLRKTRRAIKAALLDQRVLAGVGNIYADEALFAAGIAPSRPAHRLTRDELERLSEALRATLAASVTAGGSTLRDFVNALGEPGSYRSRHQVYGRGNQPCFRCGKRLRTATLGQRTTVWCPQCQRVRPQPRTSCAA